MKKGSKIILAIALVVSIIGGGYYITTKNNASQVAKLKIANTIHYEVLDDSVLSTDVLKKWVSENKLTAGVHNTSDDKFTYIIIAGGKEDTTGYGIALEKLEGVLDKITVKYSVIAPAPTDGKLEKKDSYPNMVIRLPKESRTIKGEILK